MCCKETTKAIESLIMKDKDSVVKRLEKYRLLVVDYVSSSYMKARIQLISNCRHYRHRYHRYGTIPHRSTVSIVRTVIVVIGIVRTATYGRTSFLVTGLVIHD